MNILVVDDDELIRSLFVEAFDTLGHKCHTASDGVECLNQLKNGHAFDLVLLDVQMPKLNGMETLKEVRDYDPDMSVIMISASRDINHVKEALKDGAYDYIFKPFDIKEVEVTINRAIERSTLIRQNKDYQKNLEKMVESQTHELIDLYSNTLTAMVLALDMREHETGFHSYRVTEYALTLARKMNLSENDSSNLAKGALLHDIGKIGVPDKILLKPGPLNDEEWVVMKTHPELGYNMLKDIQFLEGAADIVLAHHEKFNGTGYPNGLSKDEIPLGARIFSVIDALDAMTSKRVYKDEISFEEAAKIINKDSGSHFDYRIIDKFNSVPLKTWSDIRSNISNSSGTEYLKKLLYNLSKN